ncbi:MAG: D-alanyl-D-alanine dipeptidase [Acidobacteria bacterium]|nr:D-alanyl-D-alanine dipeptidase [Acidobacteriota bacterium]
MIATLALLLAAAELVPIERVAPAVRLDIRYATANNFTHHKVYDRAACYLRPSTAAKLAAAEREIEALGYRIKVYDCYRPLAVQKKFWALVPDERYVANPAKGSRHNRGAAVDMTLVAPDGTELAMPTPYDDFTERAHRDFQALPPEVLRNRALLERVMTKHGFLGMPTEWWHFDDAGYEKFPILDIPIESLK